MNKNIVSMIKCVIVYIDIRNAKIYSFVSSWVGGWVSASQYSSLSLAMYKFL